MKHILTIAAILLLVAGATAQNLSYSAVVRNSANELVVSKSITVAVAIANSENGAAVYSETHAVTTNQNGLVSLTIGEGTNRQGSMSAVAWSSAFITSTYTLPGDETVVNTMPVNAVPYTLYADSTGRISPETLIGAIDDMTGSQKTALRQALGIVDCGEPLPEECMVMAPLTVTPSESGQNIVFSTQVSNYNVDTVHSLVLDIIRYGYVVDPGTGERTVTEDHSVDVFKTDNVWYSSIVTAEGRIEFLESLGDVDSFAVTVKLYLKAPTDCPTPKASAKYAVPGGAQPAVCMEMGPIETSLNNARTYVTFTAPVANYDKNKVESLFLDIKRYGHVKNAATGEVTVTQDNTEQTLLATQAYYDQAVKFGQVVIAEELAGVDSFVVTLGINVKTPTQCTNTYRKVKYEVPCGTSKMKDADGHTYETVLIGNQCWTKTNLRTSRAADGSFISTGTTSSSTAPYYYVNSDVDPSTYGYYYNGEAAKLVCPAGWHLPSDAEWTALTDYVKTQNNYVCGGSTANIAKALASKEGWKDDQSNCAVGNAPNENNASGFGAVPAGFHLDNEFNGMSEGTYFWSSTNDSSLQHEPGAWVRGLFYNNALVDRHSTYYKNGFSVRCLRD